MRKNRIVLLVMGLSILSPSGVFAADAEKENSIASLLEREELPAVTAETSWELVDQYYQNTEPATQGEVSARAWMDQELGINYMDMKEDLDIREIDKRAKELVKEFQKAAGAAEPVHGGNGAIRFTYSSYTPKILCRPMRVTDIMLQPGEKVTGVHAGDTVRWTYAPGTSGSGGNAVVHVMVKPLAPDISTNLVVHTDRRVYNLDLVSSAKEFFPSVSFGYPEDEMKRWDAFITDKRGVEDSTLNDVAVDPEKLNFAYEIRGSQPWKPIRVWDDGRQVYIQMPKGWQKSGTEAPVLLLYDRKKERIANYRIKKDLIICDSLFAEKSALIAGTGSRQDRVVILKKKG
jgi:type IV secretion system protein VirB9